MRDVRLIRNNGCSGTTLHSRNCKLSAGGGDNWVLVRFSGLSQGSDSSPEYFERSISQAEALRLRDDRSSSSSVANGRINSRAAPPGALTIQPLIVRVPVSTAFPVRVTEWKEFAGIIALTGFDSNLTPDVLSGSFWSSLKHKRKGKISHLNVNVCISRSKTNGFCNMTTKSRLSFCTTNVFP